MDLSSLILPKEVFDNFTLTRLEESSEQIDLYLDELSIRPEGDHVYFSKGFTPYRSIQDYPLRGRAVYLHIRRRRWEEQYFDRWSLSLSKCSITINRRYYYPSV
jgi:hypothetical protein